MSIRLFFLSIFLIACAFSAFSQTFYKSSTSFTEFAYNKLDMHSFKDSTAIYAFNIQITVFKSRPSATVISSNDTLVSKFIIGLDSLKKFNFEPLMGNYKSVKFIVPLAVIVSSSGYNRQCIDAHLLSQKITMLFYDMSQNSQTLPTVQLQPLILRFDKKVYD